MYPIITLRGSYISLTGLGIVVTIATFLLVARQYTQRNNLQFRKLFYWMPLPIILMYVLGAYTFFVLSNGQLLPHNLHQILQILSPYDFQFHFVGLLVGLVISIVLFLNHLTFAEEKYRRIDAIAFAMSMSLIPLGLFLLLGDNVIGIPSDTRGIRTFRPDISQRASLGPVLPLGLYITVAAIVTSGIHWMLSESSPRTKRGYMTLGLMLIMINIIILGQHTPKYLVSERGGITRDVRAYVSFVVIMLSLQQFLLQKKQ